MINNSLLRWMRKRNVFAHKAGIAKMDNACIFSLCFLCATFLFIGGCLTPAHASNYFQVEGHTLDQWADAIYKAEGGNKTRHPYGILTKYKHTTPRQACKNTVKRVAMEFYKDQALGADGVFINYLARIYAPIGASNDPTGLNRHWVKNVSYWLKKGGE